MAKFYVIVHRGRDDGFENYGGRKGLKKTVSILSMFRRKEQ